MKHNLIHSMTRGDRIAGWAYFALWLLALPTVIALVCAALGLSSLTLANLIYYAVNFLFCGLIFRRMLLDSLCRARSDPRPVIHAAVCGMAAYFLSAYAAGVAITLLRPEFANANDAAITQMLGEHPVLMTLSVTLLVPVAEECLFRGLLFSSLARRSRFWAYAVTVLMFSAVHILGHLESYDALSLALCLLQYAPGAAALCRACESADSLIPPIIIHALVNTLGVIAVR